MMTQLTAATYPRTTVILRDASVELADAVVQTIAEEHLRIAVEITRNSANFSDIERYAADHPKLAIGAGTVVDVTGARSAIDLGCQFILSPVVLDRSVVELCHEAGLLVVSGGYTPTEIHTAVQNGADIVKVFPIGQLSASYIKDVRAPLGEVPIMGVGGVSIANMGDLFSRGVNYVGLGSSLFGQEPLPRENVQRILRELDSATREG
jgi:2-dehydro-3-deoxyphosphogluconate aldolase/(4S)-4-hydroxy-2-oxoglutarate aldolase